MEERFSLHRYFHFYAWFLIKNTLGWILIIASLILGPVIPGPNGIPMFLLGFAMINFPGKRRLVARTLRGKPLPPLTQSYRLSSWLISLVIPAIALMIVGHHGEGWEQKHGWSPEKARLVFYTGNALLLLAILRLTPVLFNWILWIMPKVRRKTRPTLRHMGIRLLPPRWYMADIKGRIRKTEEEIVLFSEAWSQWLSDAWKRLRPWLPKIIGLIVVPMIFYRLLKPIVLQWNDIKPHLDEIRWDLLALACLMFAANQFFCRVISWRAVLKGLGWRMPMAGSARVWATGELARYVPGMVWQVLGRAYLAKPYGLPMTTCSISQILEITICLLANVIVAVSTLSIVSSHIADDRAGLALRIATLLVPGLLVFLHPRVFYPVVNFILGKIRKPKIETKLSGRRLLGLMALAVAGQMWLGLSIWIATYSILKVDFENAWMLAGAYCLAWAAGFCMASIAPSGLGIREIVLSGTLVLVVGEHVGFKMDPTTSKALFAAIAVMLRLWATTGELIFAVIAYVWDWRGAKGHVVEVAKQT